MIVNQVRRTRFMAGPLQVPDSETTPSVNPQAASSTLGRPILAR